MKRKFYLLLISFFIVQLGFAQNNTIKGIVVDKVNEPVIGATVIVDGTSHGAMTDVNGEFTIKDVPSDATLSFTYVGMKSKKMKASSNMTVTLEDDMQNLEDVVVIGYGAAKAKDLTSPITVVKASDITSTPSTSPMTALQGKVAGVNVVSSGTPGSGPTYRQNTWYRFFCQQFSSLRS
jgi:hypothetical protein